MIKLRSLENSAPAYQTELSAGADLKAREACIIPAGKTKLVPTGVWIEKIEWELIPTGFIPELQVRARSGLAYKHGITLTNGVGTIDADYPNEIGVLLWNTSEQDFTIHEGDRIAQLVLNLIARIPYLQIGGSQGLERVGGFGSTGASSPKLVL